MSPYQSFAEITDEGDEDEVAEYSAGNYCNAFIKCKLSSYIPLHYLPNSLLRNSVITFSLTPSFQ